MDSNVPLFHWPSFIRFLHDIHEPEHICNLAIKWHRITFTEIKLRVLYTNISVMDCVSKNWFTPLFFDFYWQTLFLFSLTSDLHFAMKGNKISRFFRITLPLMFPIRVLLPNTNIDKLFSRGMDPWWPAHHLWWLEISIYITFMVYVSKHVPDTRDFGYTHPVISEVLI